MDWSGIATAYADRERARLGLPTREAEAAARQKREIEAAESASGLETAEVGREYNRARTAALPAEQALETRLREAQIRNYDETRATPQPTGPAAILAMTPEQQAAYIKFQGQLAGATRDPRAHGGTGGLSPASEAAILNRLQNQVDKSTAPGRELRRQYGLMTSGLEAARKGDLAAGSQAVLVTFQKILDPTSVVRESEYARSAAGQSALSRIQGAYDRLAQGGAGVPVAELEKFAALAADMLAGSAAFEKQTRSRARRTAGRYGIPEDVLFGDEPEEAAPTAPPTPAVSPAGPTGGIDPSVQERLNRYR